MGQLSSLCPGGTMHWLCYILLVTSLVQTVSTDSSEGSAGAAFPDDDLDEHNNYVEEEGVEGSGDSFSDDEDCAENGCRKGKKNFRPVKGIQ